MAKIAAVELKSASRVSGASSQENTQAQIAALAYQFFVDRGYQHGFDAEDWLRAEAFVKNKKK